MRILHYLLAMNLADGGVVRAVLDLCPAMAGAGHEVTIATCDAKDVPAEWRTPSKRGPGVIRTLDLGPAEGRLGTLGPGQMLRIQAAIREADVVHIHAMWLPSNDQVARLCDRIDATYVVSPHGMLDDWSMAQRGLKKRVYLALRGRRTLERAGMVHCTAQAEFDQASKWFPRGQARVVPLLLDLTPYRIPPGPEMARAKFPAPLADAPTFLFLSRLHEKKGIEPLLKACALMKQAGRRFNVAIAGSGDADYAASLRTLATELKLDDRCTFPGFVSGDLKLSLYQASDVFVLPSSQENFGFVIVEAMACELPVVLTKGVALWPDVVKCEGGVVTEATPEKLAETLGRFLDDRAIGRQMGARGRAWCMQEFDPARTTERYIDLYQAARVRGRG